MVEKSSGRIGAVTATLSPSRSRALGRKLRAAPAGFPHAVRGIARDPIESLLYIPEQFSHWIHVPVPYDVEEDWGPSMHAMIGCPWPCPEMEAYQELWGQINRELTAKGLEVGRWTYGGYSDGDPALSAAVWCAVRHLRPATVIETGVARGVTTRLILEAMAINGSGHLWSVDLPHLFGAPELDGQTGAAVPDQLRDNWTYVRGSSRRHLKPLIAQLGTVDLFIHDSLHTERNMRFEMKTVWTALRGGGLMLVDDVDKAAFRDFVAATKNRESNVYRSGDGPWLFGAIQRCADG
jgi:Methyltransferase domain